MAASHFTTLDQSLDSFARELWDCDVTEPSIFDCLSRKLVRLQSQLKVQKSLQDAMGLLYHHPVDEPLPNQRATRVKHVIKSTFEAPSRAADRYAQLRKLKCNALKFCGLCYKTKEIIEMSDADFDFLLEKVEGFVAEKQLGQYIYRDDVDKAVNCKIHPRDDALLKDFLKGSTEPSNLLYRIKLTSLAHIDERPTKRQRYESEYHILKLMRVHGQCNGHRDIYVRYGGGSRRYVSFQ